MGSCYSKQNPKRSIQPSDIVISAQVQARTLLLLNEFKTCSYLAQMLDGSPHGLDGVAYTQNQAIDLAKALLQGVIELELQQIKDQRLVVQNIFNKDNIELIRKQQLHYYGMLDKLNKNGKQLSQSIKSMVYHKIANLKKQDKINKEWRNQHRIYCIKNNNYKVLSQKQLEDLVKYEIISDRVQRMGEKIGFKFQSIKRESQTVSKVLSKVMADHYEQINKLKYSLQQPEVMSIASISREACNYYDNGVFLLLNYFYQSCKRLQNAGKSSEAIEKLLEGAIQSISKKYPPGEGLSQENQSLIKNLKQIQIKKLVKFSHESVSLKPTNKQAQVQEIISNYAKIAEQCKNQFQELVKSTCIQKAVLIKIGLKLYHKNPNQKAMTRIKEKMFFAKNQQGQKNMRGTIKQILERQETNYRKIIDELLEKSTSVPFSISDMVRGKCVFLEISDILETVKSIKDYIQKDSRFTIQEIESRFTNKTPISDVTLKIVIKKMIVAQLQLTIQTNAAAYNFAHKIYQLQRTKVFSKLKIVHNYFQESNDDFSQLAYKALKLLNSKSAISKVIAGSISKYFKLQSIKDKTFRQILPIVIQQKAQLPAFAIVVDPSLQDLMLCIFGMVTGVWYKPLGKLINSALKNEGLSPILKSVLISCFLDKFQLPKESEFMQQLGFILPQLHNKIFTEEFINEYFSIEKIFNYTSQNHRVFHRAQQLKQIIFLKEHPSAPINLRDSRFVVNLVIEQHCLQNITRLRQMFDFYFATKDDQYDTIPYQFSDYYNWIKSQLKNNKSLDQEGILSSQIAIIKARQFIEKDQLKQASSILEQAKKVFQNKEKQDKVIYCDVLLTECFIKLNEQTLQKSIQKNNTEVIKKAVTLGLQLKGSLYADSLWRISEYFWARVKNTDEKKTLAESFTKMAIRQLSRTKGKHFIYALKARWNLIGQSQEKQKLILENEKIGYAKLYNMEPGDCQYLAIPNWKNLKKLNLSMNRIGDEGCKHVSKGKWNNLTNLDLYLNGIGPQGCEYLMRGKWDNLIQLNLGGNRIGAEGCKHISNGKWDKLTHLSLWNGNQIGAEGCKYLSSAKWDNLYQLSLYNNFIGAEGCRYLSSAKWANLTQLYVDSNGIGADGCRHLSNASWDNLAQLDLKNNSVNYEQRQQLKELIIKKFPKLPKGWFKIS